MPGDLLKALQGLYESETNIHISSFWDAGWTVRLGDELNGYFAERAFRNDELGELAIWIEGQKAKSCQ
jgi:hypothetical protein